MIGLAITLVSAMPLLAGEYGYDYSQPAVTASPSYGSTYDWKTGNTYNWSTSMSGDTQVNGYNFTNGTSWRTTVEKDGDMRGTDSNGNYWNYNEGSGTYMNLGTGEIHNKKYGY